LLVIGTGVFVEGWVVTFIIIGPCSVHRLMYRAAKSCHRHCTALCHSIQTPPINAQ
jgi:hypothetical protein